MRVTKYKTMLNEDKLAYLVKEDVFNYPAMDNPLSNPSLVYKFLANAFHLSEQAEEYCYLLCFNSKMKLIGIFEISHGSVNMSFLPPREVFQKALLCNATTIIVAHNHPSGDPTPSEKDVTVMKQLKKAGDLLGVPLSDSIIIGEQSFFSFKEKEMF